MGIAVNSVRESNGIPSWAYGGDILHPVDRRLVEIYKAAVRQNEAHLVKEYLVKKLGKEAGEEKFLWIEDTVAIEEAGKYSIRGG